MVYLNLAIVLVVFMMPKVLFAAPLTTAYEDDGMVTVNGERTFIIGSYQYKSTHADAPDEELLAELAETGFNLVHSSASREELDAIHAARLMAWVAVGTLDLERREESIARLRKTIEPIKDHPALAILETVDEPAWTWKKAEPRVPAQCLVEAYPIIKEIDPQHLIYTNHAPTNLVETLRAYNAGTDIVAVDIYPVNPGGLREMYALFEDGYQGDLNNIYISQVGEYVDKMRRVAGPDRPLFMVLQAFAWEMLRDEAERDASKVLYPLYRESRFMAFQSIIRGANGVLYWGSAYTPRDTSCWRDLKRVVRELADLAGPLAQRKADIPLKISYHELGHSVDEGVQTRATIHDGKLYLLTCNADKNPCRATLSGLENWTDCTVLHEGRHLLLEQNTLTDHWEPFDVHIYVLTK